MNTDSLMTVPDVAKKLGCEIKTVWRAIDRAGRDKCTVKAFGRTLVPKNKFKEIQKFYFPRGSQRAAEMARKTGAKGGFTKAANAAENV